MTTQPKPRKKFKGRKPRAKFRVGEIVVGAAIIPKVLGVVLRNRKTGQYGVVPFYPSLGDYRPHTEKNWRKQDQRERGDQ